ncbi:RagB/SusD family nutrient uptake outer membrane protein [[Flexibacter] sp. ATCC 35208]|uniref:RagB/SusD family nutrient uptake outer membrane protein n=1 Tax=[Flexibacter] sp. ATCC 35208 TaxID=1936242 RepID=UPI0009CDA003|nr:RagB/SusD family nutrient uptake outer membrane protein [[Flexibacter] sp. ATCC 35208]OMP75781.1 RagB/SusD family nutrient uptake outer membrane protein [[Flexibacter] sp. ATCC 35208]
MRNILILLAIFIIPSCKTDLDLQPVSSVTTDNFFANSNDFIQGTNAIYNDLLRYPDRLYNLSETRSDNLYAVSDGGVRDWEGVNDFYNDLSTNAYMSEAWVTNYNGIFRANLVLENLADRGNLVTDTILRTRLQAEAKFLRAFFYFDLVRLFGKVPLIDKTVLAAEAATIGRSPVSDIYDLIISDLKYAADHLPSTNGTTSSADTYATADRGRPTKYAAKGILALVYMTRSAPTYSMEGPGLGLNEWQQAADLLNEIINSGNYAFLSSFTDIFSYSNEYNKEVVYNIDYTSGASPSVGASYPGILVPDTYFSAISKNTQGGLTIRPVSTDLLNSFEAGDIRKTFTIQTGYTNTNGQVETRSFLKKYVDITKVPTVTQDWSINFIVLRYTDVLLLKAECVLHGASGSQGADVDAIVNQVRVRAGLTGDKANVTLAELMEERRKEFAAEGTRWHDLVRSGLIISIISAWITSEDVQNKIQTFTPDYIIYPVPKSQLDIAPGLYTQNNGYN